MSIRNASTDIVTKLSFAEFIDPGVYAEAASEAILAHARAYLPISGDVTSISLNSLRTVCEKNTMLVGLSPKLTKGLKSGELKWATKKTGERFGEMTDLSGRFAGKATEVQRGVKVARTAAMAATIIVEAAHLISSADMARMQRETIEKLNRLEAYHVISNEARLEKLYFRAQEILVKPINEDRQQQIRLIRSDLLELRIIWRKEAFHNLTQIKDPRNSGWINNIFSGQQYRDEKIITNILAELDRLMFIDYTLRLDHTLGLASETWHESHLTIQSELEELKRLSSLLSEKCYYVSDRRRDRVKKMASAMAQIPDHYSELLVSYNHSMSDETFLTIEQSFIDL